MKFAIAEKLHEKYLADVVTEISQDSLWRKKLFEGQFNEQFLITCKKLEELPCHLWSPFSQYSLEFFVSKIYSCPEGPDGGCILFEFKAKGFPHLVSQVKVSELTKRDVPT
ncbi:hypothetical protein [Sporomusa sp.]|jgi:hypothetical protein|uniref:hypothetical protein n=1 Tax=Sporomusa sp. TaxID=2078658 RepID=UPI0029745D9C|nr:hypothetical protein [Sporomusa sp.]MDF2572591.1 hypothetical protein [Sporomusa sp.]HWR09873.1 hypothetical protein [Sporomusa sp.]